MKRLTCTTSSRRETKALLHAALAALIGGLLASAGAQAGIIAINTPVTSTASINFDDTNSSTPPSGITNTGPSVSPWNGSMVSLPSTTDPNTLDWAQGNIDGSFIFASNTYALNLTGITLSQAGTNTGFAILDFAFSIEFQLDAAGLPSQPTLYPNFTVNGTVQNTAGSFASVSGFIDYYGVNTAGTIGLLETVNYNSLWTTPGAFIGVAAGVPVSGTTPVLVGGTTLMLNGFIQFVVDPATINAQTFQVPEPSSIALWGIGTGILASGSARRRREKRSLAGRRTRQ
jgi:hypothetical protein